MHQFTERLIQCLTQVENWETAVVKGKVRDSPSSVWKWHRDSLAGDSRLGGWYEDQGCVTQREALACPAASPSPEPSLRLGCEGHPGEDRGGDADETCFCDGRGLGLPQGSHLSLNHSSNLWWKELNDLTHLLHPFLLLLACVPWNDEHAFHRLSKC